MAQKTSNIQNRELQVILNQEEKRVLALRTKQWTLSEQILHALQKLKYVQCQEISLTSKTQ